MARATFFLAFLAACIVVVAAFSVWSVKIVNDHAVTIRDIGEVAACLRLTDLAFATDARYTRHPSQADIFSAFQDHPGSIDHFPSGSVTAPPDFSPAGTTLSFR